MLADIPAPNPRPPLRVPNKPLPAYRYVPGLHPHPFRDPAGHMYTDGSAPVEQMWDPSTDWKTDERYLHAADLFDHRYYWEAHEAWEALWHFAEKGSAEHALLQSMIQGAAGVLKLHMGSAKGAYLLIGRAEQRMEPFTKRIGPKLRGVDLPVLFQRLHGYLQGGKWPLLPLDKV
ncbi:MAG: DUF309 domain-containing protein [Myxococcota bacterium]